MDYSKHVDEMERFCREESDWPEEVAEGLGYEVIDWGEDWEDYGKFQSATAIYQHKELEFYMAVSRSRHGDYWQGYETQVDDIYPVEPKEVTTIIYVPVKEEKVSPSVSISEK